MFQSAASGLAREKPFPIPGAGRSCSKQGSEAWLSYLLLSSSASLPATHHFASLSKHLSLNMGFLCELDMTAHGQSIFGTKHLSLLPAIVVL